MNATMSEHNNAMLKRHEADLEPLLNSDNSLNYNECCSYANVSDSSMDSLSFMQRSSSNNNLNNSSSSSMLLKATPVAVAKKKIAVLASTFFKRREEEELPYSTELMDDGDLEDEDDCSKMATHKAKKLSGNDSGSSTTCDPTENETEASSLDEVEVKKVRFDVNDDDEESLQDINEIPRGVTRHNSLEILFKPWTKPILYNYNGSDSCNNLSTTSHSSYSYASSTVSCTHSRRKRHTTCRRLYVLNEDSPVQWHSGRKDVHEKYIQLSFTARLRRNKRR